MPKKGPPVVFEVVFSGAEVYPEKIPWGALARTLSAVQRLASGKEPVDEEEEEEADKDSSLRLLDVARGSAVYRFACPAPSAASVAVQHLRLVGQVLNDPEQVGHNDYVINPIERLSATAKALECSIIVKEPGPKSPILARIEPTSFENISKTLFIDGDTSLTGEVKRVGGATVMRCALRVPFQHRLLFCTVANADVARQLGDALYKKVVVDGKARWLKTSWRVHAFRIEGVHQLKPGSLRESLQALRSAGGEGWDNIPDPAQFLDEVAGS
jgi:hypothetical protein